MTLLQDMVTPDAHVFTHAHVPKNGLSRAVANTTDVRGAGHHFPGPIQFVDGARRSDIRAVLDRNSHCRFTSLSRNTERLRAFLPVGDQGLIAVDGVTCRASSNMLPFVFAMLFCCFSSNVPFVLGIELALHLKSRA